MTTPFVRRGFTLVELLVSILVITVLSGLLLTCLGHARSLAIRTSCMSNLRQIGLGLTLFMTDHKDRGPSLFYPQINWTYTYCWENQLGEYIDLPQIGVDRPVSTFNLDTVIHSVATCPGYPKAQKAFTSPGFRTGYAANLMAMNEGDKSTGYFYWCSYNPNKPIYDPHSLAVVRETMAPSDMLIYTESIFPAIWQRYDGESIDYDRHRGTVNGVFGDGHVEALTKARVNATFDDYYHRR
jgi:prepilin-type N-terminal cleavage/methylation domain-containing protein/prepilin-type processing-associated H-X9-DG protein